MPKLASLGNVEIWIFNFDTKKHKAPHFHAESPNGSAVIGIPDRTVLTNSLRGKALAAVLAWAADPANARQLVAQWNASNPQQPIRRRER